MGQLYLLAYKEPDVHPTFFLVDEQGRKRGASNCTIDQVFDAAKYNGIDQKLISRSPPAAVLEKARQYLSPAKFIRALPPA